VVSLRVVNTFFAVSTVLIAVVAGLPTLAVVALLALRRLARRRLARRKHAGLRILK
jgi:hypothetical protein